jgi:hypothetical protein
MSFNNHDANDPNGIKYGKALIKSSGKEPLSSESGFSEEMRIGGYIKIWGSAKNRSLHDFIKWCIDNDYYFEKPIKQ